MGADSSGTHGKVEQVWPRLTIPLHLAYRYVGDEVFCWRTGRRVENRFAIVGGLGVEVVAALERRISLGEFKDSVLARYDIQLDEFNTGLEQFLSSAVTAGLFVEEPVDGETIFLLNEPALIEDEQDMSEADVLDAMFEKASAAMLPFKTFFELTHRCNERCQHCYLGFGVGVPATPALPTSRQLELLDEMAEAGVLLLVLTGGEPTLHHDFARIVQRAIDLRFAVELLTNGTRLNDGLAELVTSLPFAEIRVPIYGLEAYHNRFVRNARAFERAWKGIQSLQARGAPIVVTSVLMDDNADDLVEIKHRLDTLGVPFQVTPLVYPTIQRNSAPTQHRASREQFRAMVSQLDITLRRNRCVAGVSRFRIATDGALNPCEMLSVVEFGNVRHRSFEAVLRSPERQEWIARFHSYLEAKDRAGCRECRVRPYCFDCVGLSYLESASFTNPCQEACQLAHAMAYVDQRDRLLTTLA